MIPPGLISALKNAKRVVVFTGAGVSAESGIPTFRDALTGLWQNFNAGDLATPEAFQRDKELVWGWYEWRRMQVLQVAPNAAHLAIATLAKHVPALTVVTQNVDDLHERAGSTDVLHLHGSLHAPCCFACGRAHQLPPGLPREPEGGRRLMPPRCLSCNGFVRPGVVWFGENLPEAALVRAFELAGQCDLLISIGTSGLVQPAALLPGVAKKAGAKVLQINPVCDPTDPVSEWSLQGPAGVVMPQLLQAAFPVA
ncbi:MAG: NAD-dependent deacylase [Pseudomonadota bacterium]